MEPIIEVKNLSKKYNITHQQGGYIALRDILTDIGKHPFRFLKNKTKKIIGKETKEEFWALKDINFEVQKGEAIGIIGANGAGKSTLLKILSKITPPTTGEIKYRGRMSSLLEVGTGFHPELTGRENIFLNGAILGMAKKEIIEKFDAIVEFAGIEKFLDTPVKRYSSGMYVRLAFSVAAHMEPDILVVDEVLAVGDAEFQKKCLGKMDEVTKQAGRTILFVSHNMSAIQNLCKRCILLEDGKIKMIGETKEVTEYYLEKNTEIRPNYFFKKEKNKNINITKVILKSQEGKERNYFDNHESFDIEINYSINTKIKDIMLSVEFHSDKQILLFSSEGDSTGKMNDYNPGIYKTKITIPKYLLNKGNYDFDIIFHKPNIQNYERKNNFNLKIMLGDNLRSKIMGNNVLGKIATILKYETKKYNN